VRVPFASSMACADADLTALRRQIRTLRDKERREDAKRRKIASSAYLGERKIPDVAMMILFSLAMMPRLLQTS
jgi:hypothetical protein